MAGKLNYEGRLLYACGAEFHVQEKEEDLQGQAGLFTIQAFEQACSSMGG